MKAFQVLYVLCFTRPRYQVSVYRTTGPLVSIVVVAAKCDLVHDVMTIHDYVTTNSIWKSCLKYVCCLENCKLQFFMHLSYFIQDFKM